MRTMAVGKVVMTREAGEPVDIALWVSPGSQPARADVVADISHELGNFLHRLYYCSELLQDQSPPRMADAGAMLARTIGGLEGFLKRALEYLRPMDLARVRMAVPDVVEGLAMHLRACLPTTRLEVPAATEWTREATLVDPGRFATVAQAIARQVADCAGGADAVALFRDEAAHDGGLGVEVLVVNPEHHGVGHTSALGSLDWALAELIVNQHGGELRMGVTDEGAPAVSLWLPFAPS